MLQNQVTTREGREPLLSFLEFEVIDQELRKFGHLVLRIRDAAEWGSETDLVLKALTVAQAIAELDALRQATKQPSPWQLTRRRGLEKLVEAVIPVQAITWGSWSQVSTGGTLDPLIKVSGAPLPVIALLASAKSASPSKKELHGLELLRRVVASC